MKKNSCEKYGLAITDYVLGEKMDITKEELIAHLQTCADCRADLKNWKATYSVMRAKAFDAKPEAKEHLEELMMDGSPTNLICHKIKNAQILLGDVEVGAPAGVVWKCVGENGMVKLADLPKMTNLPVEQAYGGYGWLTRQEKLIIIKTKDEKYICLTEAERKQYQYEG
ncbi:MAG: winged helix-turn-helix domain-containing protein [Candidatus Brocadiia bacterium]